jgi:hypothetical protein
MIVDGRRPISGWRRYKIQDVPVEERFASLFAETQSWAVPDKNSGEQSKEI